MVEMKLVFKHPEDALRFAANLSNASLRIFNDSAENTKQLYDLMKENPEIVHRITHENNG